MACIGIGCVEKVGTPNCSDIWVWWRVLGLGVLGDLGHPMGLTFGSGGVYWDCVYWESWELALCIGVGIIGIGMWHWKWSGIGIGNWHLVLE